MLIITKLAPDDIRAIVDAVSNGAYAGNLAITDDGIRTEMRRDGRYSHRVALTTRDSSQPGARRSWSGRRSRATCWHAYRDVLAVVMMRDPAAAIRTGMATYNGAANFLELFPATGEVNVGSMAQPAILADLCACEADGGRDLPGNGPDYVAQLKATLDGQPIVDITIDVLNSRTGVWEVVEREAATNRALTVDDLDAKEAAELIGAAPGAPVRVTIRDEDNCIIAATEVHYQ